MSRPPDWLDGLDRRDWLFDGEPIRGKVLCAYWEALDWSKASVDMGPSPMGNPGPYWHVPLGPVVIDGEQYTNGDTVHRLYPKVLATKWQSVIRRAVEEMVGCK